MPQCGISVELSRGRTINLYRASWRNCSAHFAARYLIDGPAVIGELGMTQFVMLHDGGT